MRRSTMSHEQLLESYSLETLKRLARRKQCKQGFLDTWDKDTLIYYILDRINEWDLPFKP